MKCFALPIVSAMASVLIVGGAWAADITSPMTPDVKETTTDSGWTFSIAPYFWAAGLKGDVASFGLPEAHIDASFSDIFSNLDFAAMAMGEARNGPYSIFGDLIYTKIAGQSGTPRGVVASSVDLSAKTFAGLIGVGYTVLENDAGRLDLAAGVRTWYAKNEISFSGGILDGRSATDEATWVDAMAGFRGRYSITPEVYLTGWGLVGGGGANVDWDVAAAVGYQFNKSISALAGYRALGVDYSNDGFVFDAVQQGPILTLEIRF